MKRIIRNRLVLCLLAFFAGAGASTLDTIVRGDAFAQVMQAVEMHGFVSVGIAIAEEAAK